jgi:phage/plasmid primase-like uncharacterized protein/KaiC/GvpD/RAD55 family RecA-like ATPase
MASLVSILGADWSPPPPRLIDPPELQLYKAIQDAGLDPPDEIILDGNLRRFRSGTKGSGGNGDKTGWVVAFSDGIPAGRFGCWRAGVEHSWRADVGRTITPAEEMAHARRMTEAKARRDEERRKSQEIAADTVDRIWSDCTGASPEHPYLARKGIQPNGARVTGDGRLVVPLFDSDGCLSSLQYINVDGGKLYHPGGKTGGAYWILGAYESGKIYVAEGFATAATIHEVTDRPCVVAYSASNIVPVVATIKERYPDATITIVADHDASGVGFRYAEQAGAKYGAKVVMPPEPGMDANDYHMAGHDLMGLLEPVGEPPWLIPADDLAAQPAPISWLVKHWLQEQALIMIHGPSGGGKTFVVLDFVLRIASGVTDWHTHKVKAGNVVYLAGEGHHGLRGRIAAWKQYYQPGRKLAMHLSASGCDLNTTAGLAKVVEAIRALPDRPSVIVVDTLHRFLMGDENSAQDAKTMLDACAWLMREFSCSVVLVHHTGVSDEAQHRARGSSAWRGALDIEISVVPGGDHKPIELVQRKSKDAELAKPVYLGLRSVTIDGWIDEDGEPVTSAVLEASDAPVKPERDDNTSRNRKMFERAWFACGAEMRGSSPYIDRKKLREKLISDGKTVTNAKNMLAPGNPKLLIGCLIDAGIIAGFENGWIVVDSGVASALELQKKKPD